MPKDATFCTSARTRATGLPEMERSCSSRPAREGEGIERRNTGVWEERVNEMDVTTIGRGTIGGGLARLWEQAGHNVTTLGREGGNASDAEVVFVAVPSGSISEALGKVTGMEGK